MSGEIIVTQGSYQLKYGKNEEESDKQGNIFNGMPVQQFILIFVFLILVILVILKKKKSK